MSRVEHPVWGKGGGGGPGSQPPGTSEVLAGVPKRPGRKAQCSNFSLESRLPGRLLTLQGYPSCSEPLLVHLWASPGHPLWALDKGKRALFLVKTLFPAQPSSWGLNGGIRNSTVMSPQKNPMDFSIDSCLENVLRLQMAEKCQVSLWHQWKLCRLGKHRFSKHGPQTSYIKIAGKAVSTRQTPPTASTSSTPPDKL